MTFDSVCNDAAPGAAADKKLKALIIKNENTGEIYRMECKNAVFAVGNSSRVILSGCSTPSGVHMEAKPFSVGARIEHPQVMINESQYGAGVNDTEGRLGAAAYELSRHCADGRGVYTLLLSAGRTYDQSEPRHRKRWRHRCRTDIELLLPQRR